MVAVLGCAMLVFGVFVYKACEMEEVRLCGGRWWECQRMGQLAGLVRAYVCVCAGMPVCAFALAFNESCSQNNLCPAVIYFPGPSERKPVGVVRSTGTCPLRFIQTPPPQIDWEFALSVCVCVNECKIFKLYAQVVAVEKEVRSQFNCCLCWFWSQ